MGQIRITPDMMRTRASEYANQAEAVGEVISTMDTLLTQLQDEWEGEASKSYADKYLQLKPGFVKAQELITEISQALNQTAQAVEETDQSIANAFKA